MINPGRREVDGSLRRKIGIFAANFSFPQEIVRQVRNSSGELITGKNQVHTKSNEPMIHFIEKI